MFVTARPRVIATMTHPTVSSMMAEAISTIPTIFTEAIDNAVPRNSEVMISSITATTIRSLLGRHVEDGVSRHHRSGPFYLIGEWGPPDIEGAPAYPRVRDAGDQA
jgi:hypothetical protein